MTTRGWNRVRFFIIILAVFLFAVLTSQLAGAQDRQSALNCQASIQRNIRYHPSPDPRSAAPPSEVIAQHRGNCLEQALLFCYLLDIDFPAENLFIVFYDNGPGTVGHATALTNGHEYDLTGGLQTHTYKRRQTMSYAQALYLYAKELPQ